MHQILLIRHGEAAKSPINDDPGLTTTGRHQAEQLASALQQRFPAGKGVRLISSPKARARQTAVPVALKWQKVVAEEPKAIEIPSPEGLALADRGRWIRSLLQRQWSDLEPAQVRWREIFIDFLQELEQSAGEHHTSLVFCHFMVINSVVAAIRGNDQVTQFRPDYTSQTRITLKDGQLELTELGRDLGIGNLIQ
ncbi:histidine phosphatase family protein [Microbulbifer bruguierae]|uniref:Histidine phosphatase family protein n=1 Tax=Microbulbifer bruguierae TaxID=3029061 RepID=A0ABY8NG74_9GAMM|nr:histidine phosphatase family protein [Microbulbifer bruguierae]WGL17607.1 histidine phosphatase family protein [Microbulbifer bruguierae]